MLYISLGECNKQIIVDIFFKRPSTGYLKKKRADQKKKLKI